jgi:hypothetical protein
MPHADHMTVVENQRKDSQSAVCLPACNITTNQTQAKLFQEDKKREAMQEKGGKRVGTGEEEEEETGPIPSPPIIRRKVTVVIRINTISLPYPTDFASCE